jgi:hypothetical protein
MNYDSCSCGHSEAGRAPTPPAGEQHRVSSSPASARVHRGQGRPPASRRPQELSAKTSPQFCTIFVRVCPRLSRGRTALRPRPGARNAVPPRGRATQQLSHGKEGVSGSSPLLGFQTRGAHGGSLLSPCTRLGSAVRVRCWALALPGVRLLVSPARATFARGSLALALVFTACLQGHG